ncbi:MAG TPA: SRPBCC domain-containing protein [Gammaproteobacteria bacterium]|nr:SRPBCC domain-containing protein [Gammaproteobacteria bacterium]
MSTKTVTVRVTRRFKASPERVFDAWLDPVKAKTFLFATPTGEIVKADIDARVGGRFSIVDRRDGMDVEHTGEYLELVRPRRLKFTFRVPKFSAADSWVTLDIMPVDGGCELILTHEGVLAEYADKTPEGWGMIFDRLTASLAGGAG